MLCNKFAALPSNPHQLTAELRDTVRKEDAFIHDISLSCLLTMFPSPQSSILDDNALGQLLFYVSFLPVIPRLGKTKWETCWKMLFLTACNLSANANSTFCLTQVSRCLLVHDTAAKTHFCRSMCKSFSICTCGQEQQFFQSLYTHARSIISRCNCSHNPFSDVSSKIKNFAVLNS